MTQVTQPFDRVLDRIRKEIEDPEPNAEVIQALAEIGRATIEAAANSKATGNLTMNQIEGFGWAVFFKGQAQRQGFLDKMKWRGSHVGRSGKLVDSAGPDPKRHKMGRIQALQAISAHKPGHNWYELYLVNAMWYTSAHEDWGLRVLSQELMTAVHEIALRFGVEVYFDFYNFGW